MVKVKFELSDDKIEELCKRYSRGLGRQTREIEAFLSTPTAASLGDYYEANARRQEMAQQVHELYARMVEKAGEGRKLVIDDTHYPHMRKWTLVYWVE